LRLCDRGGISSRTAGDLLSCEYASIPDAESSNVEGVILLKGGNTRVLTGLHVSGDEPSG
jgi:hypothetical protein